MELKVLKLSKGASGIPVRLILWLRKKVLFDKLLSDSKSPVS